MMAESTRLMAVGLVNQVVEPLISYFVVRLLSPFPLFRLLTFILPSKSEF